MRVQLDRCYIYKGRFYGPGKVDVPNGLAANLGLNKLSVTIKVDDTEFQAAATKVKSVLDHAAIAKMEKADVSGMAATAEEAYATLTQAIAEPEWTEPGTDLLPEETPYLGILQAGGVTTVHDALSHPDLTQIKNIGPGRAFKIIEFLEA
jgi:hypothetical protein